MAILVLTAKNLFTVTFLMHILFFFTKSKIKFIFKLFAKKTIARMEAHAIVWMTLIIVHAQMV